MSDPNTKKTWFEKTVEYNFVLNAKEICGLDFFSPLDGTAERIADLVAGSDAKHYIIEFKKKVELDVSEFKKYKGGEIGYIAAKNALQNTAGYNNHFIIGGDITSDNKFQLKVKHYFPVEDKTVEAKVFQKDNDALFSLGQGITIDQLKEYTKIITQYRDSTEGGEGGSGGVKHVSIVAVSKDKEAVTIPLHYYIKHVLNLTNTYINTPKPPANSINKTHKMRY